MRAIEVICNGKSLVTVGALNALMFSVDITLSLEGDSLGYLHVRGMNDLGDDRASHAQWLEDLPLADGDTLALRFIETDSTTAPATEVATDSEEHLAEQAWYSEQLESNPPRPREITPKHAHANLQVSCGQEPAITATLEGGREFISLHLVWSQWRPDRCRVSLHSFSQQEALAKNGHKDWLTAFLALGEHCTATAGSKD